MASIPRGEIPWFPTVDYELCVGCQECYNFCHNGVFEWDEESDHPIVANPYNCVVLCSACSNACSSDAISFPSREEIIALVKALREKYAELPIERKS